MRKSPIHDLLAERGASFGGHVDAVTPMRFSSFEEEYHAVREGVGLTDFSFTNRFRVPEDGFDVLEQYAAGSVANIRFGRVLHTLAVDEEGLAESDLHIANDDEELFLIAESLVDRDTTAGLLARLGGDEAGLEDISESTALFGLDGYKAWSVVMDLFGADVLGLPYLSLETYELDDIPINLFRSGKTSEFGYLLQVPAESAAHVWQRAERAGQAHGLRPVGLETHFALRLDGRFFNIYAEGAQVRDPLTLGLQWMFDFDGEDFRGREAIMARRAKGLTRKIIGVVPSDKATELPVGSSVVHQGETVGTVVASGYSPVLSSPIGLAVFDLEYAYSGLEYATADGKGIRTVSMPPFLPKSLTVKLDEI